MPPFKYKTGVSKKEQRKQVLVYVDSWVDMHNKISELEQQIKYWMIEAKTDHDRWLRVLEDLDKLQKEYNEFKVSTNNSKKKTKIRRD